MKANSQLTAVISVSTLPKPWGTTSAAAGTLFSSVSRSITRSSASDWERDVRPAGTCF